MIGRENLAAEGPAIVVSNHPNAFLDGMLLATADKGKFHYIAGAEWFGKGLRKYIFRNELNMIPVVRPWLKTGEKVSNDEMFEQCYVALADGKRIVIYPEGTSITVSNVRELKTGAIRIKMGGDKYLKKIASKWKEVKIIPVGVNYYAPRTFQSDVILNIGAPIDYSHINESEEKEQVGKMTEETRRKMSALVFHFEEKGFDTVSKDVYRYYGEHLKQQYQVKPSDKVRVFQLQKRIVDAVHYFHQKNPKVISSFKEQADQLTLQLKNNKLDIRYLGEYKWPIWMLIRLIFGFPFFLSGWLLNVIPFKLTQRIFEKFLRPKFATTYETGKLNPSFLASMAFLLGMVVFILWYLTLSITLGIWAGWWWVVPIFFVSGYLLGVYVTRYARIWYDFSRMILVVNRRRKRKDAYQKIKEDWDQLIVQLQGLKLEFEKDEPSV